MLYMSTIYSTVSQVHKIDFICVEVSWVESLFLDAYAVDVR